MSAKKTECPVTLERLRQVLNFAADTGQFTWREVPKRSPVHVGDVAGGISGPGTGYVLLTVDFAKIQGARAAWFHHYGEWPVVQVGHRDGDALNNRINNLYLIEKLDREANPLTQDRLRSLLNYDSTTGVFTWRVSSSNRSPVGSEAGAIGVTGYRIIGVDGIKHLAHRLAIFYMTGKWPAKAHVDHRNGNKADNSWANLREATFAENSHNAPMRATNTSGYKGVSWAARKKKWVARITNNYRVHVIGYYATKEEAHKAYCDTAAELHGEFAHTGTNSQAAH